DIEKKFEQFIQEHHIRLDSLQQRFLALLKKEICSTGQISVSRLYEQPFTSLHQDGIDGLFDDEQAQLIANFIARFAVADTPPQAMVQVKEARGRL
ncbi:MAG TPA: type I restriction-modification enzyme R subunit C-terminal domain-containing protein, partial [Cellvibrionaceae bacterium]